MHARRIALGFSNTLDYELVWDASILEGLLKQYEVGEGDLRDWKHITSMQRLLGSIAFHFRRGTGCGAFVEEPEVLEVFWKNFQYALTLGGTGVRAALALSQMGVPSLVHLISWNPETLGLLPQNVAWVCSQEESTRYPHVVLQYPKGATLRLGGITLTAPQSNRVIYTSDTDSARLLLAPDFFRQAEAADLVVLSSFDLIQSSALLEDRLGQAADWLGAHGKGRCIFYEDACFTRVEYPAVVQRYLLPYIDLYSMNEDEFQSYAGEPVDLLSVSQVAHGLRRLRERLPGPALVVHTKHWALAYAPEAQRFLPMLLGGNTMAGTRFRCGDALTREAYQETLTLAPQPQAERFAEALQGELGTEVCCLPAYALPEEKATTIGLGDSFVGGAIYALHQQLDTREKL